MNSATSWTIILERGSLLFYIYPGRKRHSYNKDTGYKWTDIILLHISWDLRSNNDVQEDASSSIEISYSLKEFIMIKLAKDIKAERKWKLL